MTVEDFQRAAMMVAGSKILAMKVGSMSGRSGDGSCNSSGTIGGGSGEGQCPNRQ